VSLPTIYLKANQTDKARESAQRLIDFGTKTNTEKLVGAGHYLIGQAAEKAKDYSAAAQAYITSYGILKNPQIAADLKKLGKTLYDAKKFADAEKIYRQFYASAKDADSAIILGQTLNKMGKTDEALDFFKEAYGKKKTGELAYNIAVILNSQAKSNPSLVPEVINYFLEASFLYPAKSKDCMQYAQSLYFTSGNNAKYNDIIKKIQEHNNVIEEYMKTFNERFEGKDESELSGREKSALNKLQEAIDRERAAITKLQAEQKSIVDGFNRLVDRVRSRLGG
jgi:tetratricopeptide (TPR) repeat protein